MKKKEKEGNRQNKGSKVVGKMVLRNIDAKVQEDEVDIVQFHSQQIIVQYDITEQLQKVSFEIGDIELLDLYNSYLNEQNNGVIKIKQTQQQNFINLSVHIEKEKTKVQMELGTIIFNIKPNFIKKMVEFGKPENEKNQILEYK